MIHICNPDGKLIKSFKNDDAFNHLSAGELLEDHPEVDVTQWSFVIFPPQRVPDLYLKLKKESIASPIRQAYEQQLGVIEICKGDYTNPTWIPITLGLEMGKLKKEWYLDFCKRYGYVIEGGNESNVSPDAIKTGDAR